MANSYDPDRRYEPHESVLNHPVLLRDYISNKNRRDFITRLTVGLAISYIAGWRVIYNSAEFRSYVLAIEWDLKINYGVTDEQLL